MPTIEQIRAARALLDWSQTDLAEKAGLSQTGIARLENGTHQPNQTTLDKIHAAFLSSGLEFIQDGVRKTRDRLLTFEGTSAMQNLLDDVYNTLYETEPDRREVCLLGINELKPEDDNDYSITLSHIERLKNIGASERIIVNYDETSFIAPRQWYRKVADEFFSPHTVYIYGTKIALLIREDNNLVLILDNPYFALTMTKFFDFVWEHGEKA